MPEKNKLFYREMQLDGAVDQESRTVPISFSSEKSVKRFDWRRGEYYNEILGHEAGNVDLTRLSEMGVALFNHDTDRVIGAIIDPVLDAAEHRCKAKIRFDEDEFSEMIYQKVLRGTLKGISVGYGVGAWEEVAAGQKSTCGRFEGPCKIARQWTPYEVSSVSVPADADVGVERGLPNITDSELQEFRNYLADKKRRSINADLQTLKREIDLLEMEG